MTYPPPGGGNPQYQLQPEPQQPSDPYSQGYNSTPPPGNYYQQQPPQQYTQPSNPQYPPVPIQPTMNVQPGYPSAPGSVLPPPMPPANQGSGNLGVILGVIVALVVVLGVAAVLIIPGMMDDDDPQAGGDPSESAAPSEEESSEDAEAPVEEEATTPDAAADDDFATWGTPVNSEEFAAGTPEAAAINYRIGSDTDDDDLMQAQVCAEPTSAMQTDLEWELEYPGYNFDFLLWSMSREVDGGMEVWVGWTMDDSEPNSTDEMEDGSGYTFTAVEEGGVWKLCDVTY
ncbi:hypothetical protein [Glycomyces sp. YM15]|uniref:hypothetical protein n=1 Tax=Glycomyces sp. YM15 TaxID=2800446 RepID=UPI00196666C6|nr:hypothetical protein [Glycomyces sp. YM15]